MRGTTLKQSIIGILDRLHPKKIVIVSSSPQVRYPDYYGIDMASMEQFIAFKAAIALLEDRGMQHVIEYAYRKSKAQTELPKEKMANYVKEIYAPFTDEEISAKIVELLTPAGTQAKVQIVYQTLEGLHEACPPPSGRLVLQRRLPHSRRREAGEQGLHRLGGAELPVLRGCFNRVFS